AGAVVAAGRAAASAGDPLLLLGGGSNLVVADEGWPGLVLLLRSHGVDLRRADGQVVLTVQAGEPWDDLVARVVAEGLAGIECLAGIPGRAGAPPGQNVGPCGQEEVAEIIRSVTAWDRDRGALVTLSTTDCGFAYRSSVFKHTERYVVLSVTFALEPAELSAPVRYAELARALGVTVGERAKLADVRDAVLELRHGKGMVLDPADHDTWSAGSFFTNPVLSAPDLAAFEHRLPPGTDYPRWPAPDGAAKLSAAWLIEHAGFGKGYRRGPAALSGKH